MAAILFLVLFLIICVFVAGVYGIRSVFQWFIYRDEEEKTRPGIITLMLFGALVMIMIMEVNG